MSTVLWRNQTFKLCLIKDGISQIKRHFFFDQDGNHIVRQG